MSKREIRYKINQYKLGLGKANSAVSDVNNANANLYKSRDSVGNSICGKTGSNIYNNIQSLITSSNGVINGLNNSASNIRNEIWNLEYQYDNEEE